MASNNTEAATFAITDIKLYAPGVNLLTQDNAKLLEQLKLGFKRTIDYMNQNYQCKHQSHISIP